MKTFKNILDFQKEFSTDEKCREYFEQQRWNGTPACPFCGSLNVHRFPNAKIFKCREKGCRSKFSVTVGSIYENTKIPLTKWFLATYILSVHSKGISSLQLATWLGVTQKTAWHLNHRIRQSLTIQSNDVDYISLTDIVEALEGGRMIISNWLSRKDTLEYLSLWESLHNPNFNFTEIDEIAKDAGKNSFSMSPKRWIESTNPVQIDLVYST